MKKSILGSAMALLTTSAIFAQSPVAIPTGSLNIDQDLVRRGTAPVVTWNIQYPETIDDIIEIDPTDTIIPIRKLKMTVRMIGVGLSNGYIWSPAQVKMGISGHWSQVWWGTDAWIDPNAIAMEKIVYSNQRIEFASRFQDWAIFSRPFSPWYHNGNHRVALFKNGDIPPTLAAGYPHQTSIEDYLRPYLDDNNRLQLGPRDLIYAAELTSGTFGSWGFDQQDAIVIVTFTPVN